MKDNEAAKTAELTRLLSENPQEAMALIVERYAGLLWSVVQRYLDNPEDIKECVNDTFFAFYSSSDTFDPAKGTLAVFLCAIAEKKAISLYRKNKSHPSSPLPETTGEPEAIFEQSDLRMDLDRAIQSLQPEDAGLIRMKYYGGMSMREIADSLHLPYETVKKRHQRILGKMRMLLLAVLALLLAALLAACAYVILRYFGVIPGVGVNPNPDIPFYVLEETVTAEGDQFDLQLEKGLMSQDSLTLTINMTAKDGELFGPYKDECFLNLDGEAIQLEIIITSERSLEPDSGGAERSQRVLQFKTPPALPKNLTALPFTLRLNGLELSFSLSAASEELLEQYQYAFTEEGGVLAIPSLEEDGHLYVDLYPLNCGAYTIDPTLVRGLYETAGGPVEPITATAEDGTVLTGQCMFYTPVSTNTYFRWDFGPAGAGSYVLDIPYLYQSVSLPEDFSFLVSDAEPNIGQSQSIPGCTLTIRSYSPEQPAGTEIHTFGGHESETLKRFLAFDVSLDDPQRILVGLESHFDYERPNDGQVRVFQCQSLMENRTDGVYFLGIAFHFPEGCEQGPVELSSIDRDNPNDPNNRTAIYRWNHPFSIPLQVEAEP